MPVVKVHLALCEGYGNGVPGVADVFDVDDLGLVEVLRTESAQIAEAAACCSVAAVCVQ